MRVLVLGASGTIGNSMLRVLSKTDGWDVYGTVRSADDKKFFSDDIASQIISDCDVENNNSLIDVFTRIRPDVVINCIGLIKHLAHDPMATIQLNALLPHRLQKLCALVGARLIHFSTDCVFSGAGSGNYREDAPSDAVDLYGKSKFLGEVNCQNAITLRTSTIGRELQSAKNLLGWFLSQDGSCKGYRKAIFSGLPTVVLAQIVRDLVIPNPQLSGLYHVAAQPISKYDLLKIVADVYGKSIEIVADDGLVINRSLNADRFNQVTGYHAPSWPALIQSMHDHG